MNDFDQSYFAFQAAERARRSAEYWLVAFETALVSGDGRGSVPCSIRTATGGISWPSHGT